MVVCLWSASEPSSVFIRECGGPKDSEEPLHVNNLHRQREIKLDTVRLAHVVAMARRLVLGRPRSRENKHKLVSSLQSVYSVSSLVRRT